MDSAAINHEMQALLAHSHWVQELARRLVRDPNVAEDLAQETMLAAIRDRDRTHRSAKAWLGTVLRNLVWERVRREDRRGAREVDAAREEAVPSTIDLMDRMAAHKELVEVLMTLPDTYREVLLRRYFEGESPNEIARSLDIPHSTVRTRLSRATAMMRERLNEEHGGDGRAWVTALLPLAQAPLRGPEAAATAAKLSLIPLPVVLVASLVLISLAALGWMNFREETAPLAGLANGEALAIPTALAEDLDPNKSDSNRRQPSVSNGKVSESSTAAARATQAPAARSLRGRVVDVAGKGQAGVLVRFELYTGKAGLGRAKVGLGDPLVISDASGAFSLRDAPSKGWVVAERDDLVTVLAGTPSVGGARDSLVVVTAPRLEFAGRVLDESGAPIANAAIALRYSQDFTSGFPFGLEASTPVPFETTTNEQGAFRFERAPGLNETTLVVEFDGFEPLRHDLPAYTDLSLELELQRSGMDSSALMGEVVGPDGNPIARASVSDGRFRTFSDANGQFRLQCGEEAPTSLMAMIEGLQPALVRAQLAPQNNTPVWPEFVVLTLGPPPLELYGRLVDSAGRGMRGVRVWVAEPTLFWTPSRESADKDVSTRIGVVPLGGRRYPDLVEGVLGELDEDRESPWPYVVTDADGAFVLKGLLDREYALEFLDSRTLMHMRSRPIRAGRDDAIVTWNPGPNRDRVEGRVVSKQGDGLRGLSVGVLFNAFSIMDGEQSVYSEQLLSKSVKTDSEGRFLLRDVPIGSEIYIEGPDTPMTVLAVIEADDSEHELVLEVAALARVRVALVDPELGDSFSVKSQSGEVLPITVVEGPRKTARVVVPLAAGRSGVLYVPHEATRLELYRAGELVQEIEIRLKSGSINQLDF